MKVQDGEQIVHEFKPEKNILWIWLFTKCLSVGLAAGFAGVWVFGFWPMLGSDSDFAFSSAFIGAAVVGLPCLGLALLYCRCLRRTYVYYITNQRCVFHGGILRRVERSIPYHKVTDVEMSQNIIERILCISTLNIFTPGTSSRGSNSSFQKAEISFVGLKDNESPADTINGILRKFRATGE